LSPTSLWLVFAVLVWMSAVTFTAVQTALYTCHTLKKKILRMKLFTNNTETPALSSLHVTLVLQTQTYFRYVQKYR
jgi:hypothetical protein